MRKLVLAILFLLGGQSGHAAQAPSAQSPESCQIPYVCQPQTEDKPNSGTPKETYWQKAFKPDVLPVWIGAVAALLASVGGLIALRSIRKQTKVALLTAEAARDAVEVSMNAERAWILDEIVNTPIVVKQGYPIAAHVLLKNHGRITARVTSLKMRFHLVDLDNEDATEALTSNPPNYGNDPFQFLELGTTGLVLAPQQSVVFSLMLEGETVTKEQEKKFFSNPPQLTLFLYGIVSYDDGFKKDCLTQFCYTLKGLKSDRIGPGGWNNAT
jgi:hypothetical protein